MSMYISQIGLRMALSMHDRLHWGSTMTVQRPLQPLIFCLAAFLGAALVPAHAASAKATAGPVSPLERYQLIDADHRDMIREHLKLSPEEAALFWPIYEDYLQELKGYLRQRVDSAKRVAERLETFDDAAGEQVVMDMLAIDKTPGRLWERFIPRFIKAVGGRKTARFYQVERRIRVFIDAELSREFPLIP